MQAIRCSWFGGVAWWMLAATAVGAEPARGAPLPGTELYVDRGDLVDRTMSGIEAYLQRRTDIVAAERPRRWNRDRSQTASVARQRGSLAYRLGVVDDRLPITALEQLATTAHPAEVGRTDRYVVYAVRWPVIDGITGEGLLLAPRGPIRARIVALGDADHTPEMLAGLAPGVPAGSQFARRLAENGCQVLVPVLIDRRDEFSGNELVGRYTNQPHREWLYRQAYQVGRHPIGYEVQKVLAAVDWFTHENQQAASLAPVGVAGYGEGGLLAYYAAALDERIGAALVSGYFGPREQLWQEPIYRNVWGLLRDFGDAEVASLIVPRGLVVEPSQPPEITGPPEPRDGRRGAAPGAIVAVPQSDVQAELQRAAELVGPALAQSLHVAGDGSAAFGSEAALRKFCGLLFDAEWTPAGAPAVVSPPRAFDIDARQLRQVRQIEDHVQRLVERADFTRAEYFWQPARERMQALTSSTPETAWQRATQPLREAFWNELIGALPEPSGVPAARTMLVYDEPRWRGYLVELEVWPEVISWGYLLLPKDLAAGERRPVVVCQHGLSGVPQNTFDPESTAYRGMAGRLAERGFVVYCPYNPNAYGGGERFRQLQRRANPLGCSIFSVITRQHQQILQWLGEQPFVDAQRIGFYGLSYGGKTAMRVPAVLEGYALSICSGDFNEWIRKTTTPHATTSVRAAPHSFSSYMFTGEYEIGEFNLAHTMSYAEMAALIAPRPFMVERGHRDRVASDELVAYEYATVRRLYVDLNIADRTSIEFFDDGHVIHGQGSFQFLHKHLAWPER